MTPNSHGGDGEAYDVIVIGSGIGGMIAASLLAQSGQRVLVAEQHSGPGGYSHSFRRGPYTIDPAVHSIADPAFFDALLRHLGVRDQCTFLPVDRFYSVFVEAQRFAVPLATPDEIIETHVRWFPESEKEIRKFLGLCYQVHREAHSLPQRVDLDRLEEVASQFPTLFKYRNALLKDVLDECFTDPRPKGLCPAFSVLLGLPASRQPFQSCAQLIASYSTDMMFQCQGGAEQIIQAPIKGLYLAGHWTQPGGGWLRAAVSGAMASRLVLSDLGRLDSVDVFRAASLPPLD